MAPRSPATNRVVVGIDGSDIAVQAARSAALEAARRRWALRLVHVRAEHAAAPERVPGWLRAAESAVRETAPQVALDVLVRSGPVARVLLEEANSARLLVIGTRGLGRPAEAFPDSTTLLVAIHAPCPVIVVPGDTIPRPPLATGPVVVGVDGSPVSEAALAYAFDAASVRGAELHAVHTWSDVVVESGRDVLRGDQDRSAVQQEEDQLLAERIAGWQEKYPDVRVRRSVSRGLPVDELLDHAGAAQLLVVGSRGRGGYFGMLLGSTSQALLYCSPCPIAVVRPETMS